MECESYESVATISVSPCFQTSPMSPHVLHVQEATHRWWSAKLGAVPIDELDPGQVGGRPVNGGGWAIQWLETAGLFHDQAPGERDPWETSPWSIHVAVVWFTHQFRSPTESYFMSFFLFGSFWIKMVNPLWAWNVLILKEHSTSG